MAKFVLLSPNGGKVADYEGDKIVPFGTDAEHVQVISGSGDNREVKAIIKLAPGQSIKEA
jgi:hypothetical protein